MSIEQNEIELKELLTRVMRDPLQPLQVQLDRTSENVDHLDKALIALREVEIGDMCERLAAVEKALKRLNQWAEEDAGKEFKNVILPPVQGALDTLALRIESNSDTITRPVQIISQDLAQTGAAVEQLAQNSKQATSHALLRDASFSDQIRNLSNQQAEQWKLTQVLVRESTQAAVEQLSAMSASASAAQQSNLQRLVEVEVSKRIDQLVIMGRWAVGLAVTAVFAVFGCLALLLRSLQY